MTFIPANMQLEYAIRTNDVLKVEELILNSDSRKELISEHIVNNGKDSLINLLPEFKSKGLILNLQTLLNI